jgi:hypothetical protein
MKAKHKVRGVHIKRADNGGHVVSADYDDDGTISGQGYRPPAEHVFGASERDKMLAHVHKELDCDDEPPQTEAKESGATEQAEQKAKDKRRGNFPMKGRANLAAAMLRRAESTSKAKGKST